MKKRILSSIISVLCLSAYSAVLAQDAVFAVMPDAQTYLTEFPEIMEDQVGWICKQKRKYDAVIQLGDITQTNHPLEWYTVSTFVKQFEKQKIPFVFAVGNHDMGSRPRKIADTRNTDLANRYFPVSRMSKQKGWGGTMENKIDEHYMIVKAGGIEWLLISLSFGPSDDALAWANKVVEQNKDKAVIVVTHAYMYSDSTRMGDGDSWIPQHYDMSKVAKESVNDGEQMWEKFVSKHSNIAAVLCGHVLNSGVGTLVSEGKNGNKVYQMLSNYQAEINTREDSKLGYTRVLSFDKKKKQLKVETISTVTGQHHPSAEHNFTFEGVDIDAYLKR